VDNLALGKPPSPTQWMSLLTSLTSVAGFAVSMIATYDTPEKAEIEPAFYGMLPKNRAALFVFYFLLMVNSIARQVSFLITLATLGTLSLVLLIGVPLLVILVKITRDDFFYWSPAPSKAAHIINATLNRSLGCILVAFCAALQLRYSCELGGACWIGTQAIWGMVGLLNGLVALVWHGGPVFSQIQVCSEITFWVSLALVLAMCPSHLRRTFFSAETGKEYLKLTYWSNQTSEMKIRLISETNYLMWVGYEDEVQEWLSEAWEREWKNPQNQPEYFKPEAFALVPQHLLPSGLKKWITKGKSKVKKQRTLGGSMVQVIAVQPAACK
jgi:hypothetical protein